MTEEVLIIGGGVTGLSAAIHAIDVGLCPVILEKNRFVGGRARSFWSKDIRETLDNGQHVLSAAYRETIKLLTKVNSIYKISFQKNLEISFVENPLKRYHFRSSPFPAPFHFFSPLIFHKKSLKINLSDIINFIWKNLWLNEKVLRKMTIVEWLNICGQSQNIQNIIWKPMCFSILNATIEQGSALLLKNAIYQSFLRSKKKAPLGFPGDWLGKIFADPASKYILHAGGQIHLFNTVQKFIEEKNSIKSVITNKKVFTPKWIISTIPPFALHDILLKNPSPKLHYLVDIVSTYNYNPIININIFVNKPLNEVFPISIISSPLQWIFPHPNNRPQNKVYGYTIVMSAAHEWINKSKEELLDMTCRELKRVLQVDFNASHRLIKYKIIKEKRATIAQTPEVLNLPISSITPLENLFLAGDWIYTGLPATIEGAIRSGRLAIRAIQKSKS